MFTDGITEAMNEQEEEYTDQSLEYLLAKSDAAGPKKLIDEILVDVRRHQGNALQSDDITILAVQFLGAVCDEEKHLALKIPNQMSEIAVVEKRFQEFAETNAILDSDRQMLSVVLDELLNNVIRYAYPEGGDHLIDVDLSLHESRLVLVIEDDGIPFNPFAAATPDTGLALEERKIGGLGIHLVRKTMDECLYQRRANRNVVILVKQLSGFKAAEAAKGAANRGPDEDS
jgi:anti-sigma regulatory factor (Ser/Thr protein kinase)